MDFTFDELKNLFYTFNLKQDIYGQYFIVNRQTGIPYNDGLVVDYVKFAHTWVYATTHNRSLKKDSNIMTQEDYDYAFNEEAREVYNLIMNYSNQVLKHTGRMIGKERLIEYIRQNGIPVNYLKSIVDAIYSQENFYNSYEIWVRYSTQDPSLYPIETISKRRHK